MYVEALSLFTAFCYGLSAVLVRKGMRGANPITAALLGAGTQVMILSALLVGSSPGFSWLALAFFAASGVFASTLGRLFNYMSIERLGVPLSASIIGSSPLFSTAFAIIFLGERVAVSTIAGSALVVAGIALASGGRRTSSLKGVAIVLPTLSAAFYGASSVVRKVGLDILPESILGATVGASASLMSYTLYIVASRRLGEVKLEKISLGYFVASGIVISAGWVAMFNALQRGSVSVVSTLIGANPLFSLTLSALMLRETDSPSVRVVAGCLAIVFGVALVTLFGLSP